MTRSPCPTPRPLAPRAPPSHSAPRHFSSRTSAPLATRHGISYHAFARSSLLMSPPFVPLAPPVLPGAKPTAVGKARICVSKTGKYSIKRQKLLYFFAFFKVLFKKIPLNSRGGKILRSFLPSCRSGAISRFSGGKRTPLRVSRPPLFGGTRARFSRAPLITLFLLLILFLPATLVSEPPCQRKSKAPQHAGLCSFFFNSFADGLATSPTADAFLPAMV